MSNHTAQMTKVNLLGDNDNSDDNLNECKSIENLEGSSAIGSK